jgi:hypothetical protein
MFDQEETSLSKRLGRVAMTRKPQDDEGFPTSQELSREKDRPADDLRRAWDPWRKAREKQEKLKKKREALLKRYRDGKL